MASDDAYAAFLEKANQDPSEGHSKPAAPSKKAATTSDSVPEVLIKATKDAFYTSDSDEPFEAVAIPCKEMPDDESFASVTGIDSVEEVTILDPIDWDRQGQYKSLLDAVRKAGKGNDVRVYRAALKGGTRLEYWLVTLSDEGQLVGVKAKAVES